MIKKFKEKKENKSCFASARLTRHQVDMLESMGMEFGEFVRIALDSAETNEDYLNLILDNKRTELAYIEGMIAFGKSLRESVKLKKKKDIILMTKSVLSDHYFGGVELADVEEFVQAQAKEYEKETGESSKAFIELIKKEVPRYGN